jgi:hypothetical protein
MDIHSKNFLYLLRGGSLVLEIVSDNSLERTWVELELLNRDLLPDCPLEKAAFTLRYATYWAEDIANDYDLSEDKIGKYIEIPSILDLDDFLKRKKLTIDDFTNSYFTDYPNW